MDWRYGTVGKPIPDVGTIINRKTVERTQDTAGNPRHSKVKIPSPLSVFSEKPRFHKDIETNPTF
jgi:hypothetical protein